MNRSKLFLLSLILFLSVGVFFIQTIQKIEAAYNWQQINQDFFGKEYPYPGTHTGEEVFAQIDFNNCLYVGVENRSVTQGAGVYRTCDGGQNWLQVNSDGFGDPVNNDHVDSMAVFNGKLYVSTGTSNNTFNGTEVWSSSNGTDWTKTSHSGLLPPEDPNHSNNENLKSFVIFQNKLCGGTWNGVSGGAVWCTDNGIDWGKMSPDGMNYDPVTPANNKNNQIVWILKIFNGQLYASIQNSVTGGQVWRTANLVDWEPVTLDSFTGGATSVSVAFINDKDGNFYLRSRTSSGTPVMLASSDGLNFNQIATIPTTSLTYVNQQVSVKVGNYVYMSTNNPSSGTQVLRSTDLINWEAVSQLGVINDPANIGSLIYLYNNKIYLGVINYTSGHRIYSLDVANNIFNIPSGYSVYDTVAGLEINSQQGSTGTNQAVSIKKTNGELVATANIDISEDRDWNILNIEENTQFSKQILTSLQSVPGLLGGSYNFYYKPAAGFADNGLVICPNATSVDQISQQCENRVLVTTPGSIEIEGNSYLVSKTTIDNIDYWVISSLDRNLGVATLFTDYALGTGSLRINNGFPNSSFRRIRLQSQLNSPLPVIKMRISENGNWKTGWIDYASSIYFTLSNLVGNHRIIVEYLDIAERTFTLSGNVYLLETSTDVTTSEPEQLPESFPWPESFPTTNLTTGNQGNKLPTSAKPSEDTDAGSSNYLLILCLLLPVGFALLFVIFWLAKRRKATSKIKNPQPIE